MSENSEMKLKGIGGWLNVYIIILRVIVPFFAVISSVAAAIVHLALFQTLGSGFLYLGLYNIAQIISAAVLAVLAGNKLNRVEPGALVWVYRYVYYAFFSRLLFVLGLFYYSQFDLSLFSQACISLAIICASFLVQFAYIKRSKRIKLTY